MRDVYVISSCRTAVGTFGGSLRDVPAADLGATVIAEALKRGNVKGEWLDEVMFGNVLSAAQGQNVARQCMVKAGVPLKVPAYTVSTFLKVNFQNVFLDNLFDLCYNNIQVVRLFLVYLYFFISALDRKSVV